jgi:bifunctional DNA primase/polymerase-like protein
MFTGLTNALDNTIKYRTGSGGEDIIFRIEDSTIIEESVPAKNVWIGSGEHSLISIFGNDRYIVMPPSRHPKGKRYEWDDKTPKLIRKEELNEFLCLVTNNGTTLKNKTTAALNETHNI